MKSMLVPVVAGLLAAALAAPSPADQKAEEKLGKLRGKATAFVESLRKADFNKAVTDFDDTMKEKLPADKLEDLLKKMSGQLGPLQKQDPARSAKAGKYDCVLITCHFKKLALDARIVFADDGRITGFFLIPAATAEYKPPAYVNQEAFRETEVKVGAGDWVLPGTLSMPKGTGPFPAVVLVHGSGPNDRDETVLGHKPFRDLAWGLASRGIAVLRYEKRTREHGARLAKDSLTVQEEVIDDALAAAALLRKTPGVDGTRVFVLGHSLGAMMAPSMAVQDPALAGVILLASPTRQLEDVVVAQFTYLFSLKGEPSEDQKAELDKIKKQAARLKEPNLPADTPASELPLGAPLRYWQSLRKNHPPEVALKVKQPMLILQGERDYQVTMDDFNGWKKALTGQSNVTLKSYPKLNHLFAEGEGKSTPDEYKAGHVAEYVIEDIAAWIKKP